MKSEPYKQLKTSTDQGVKKQNQIIIVPPKNNDENEEEEDSEIRWKYLEHHGVVFPDYWNKHNVKVTYDGKIIELNLF